MICVMDACFVIDWSLYGRRDILKIWSALDILKEAASKGIITDFEKALEEYSTETKHFFKKSKK